MTSKEFAKLIGVSQSTVSRAMNKSSLVSEEKRKFIIAKAEKYNFTLNSHAKSLRTQRAGTIGILFPKHFTGLSINLMLAKLYDLIHQEMHNYDYDIMVIYYSDEDDFSSFERIIRKRKVDGFLVMKMELSENELMLIDSYQVPCVFMLNAGKIKRKNLNYFFSDSEYGGYVAGRYLGNFTDFQKIALIAYEELDDVEARIKGFRKGLQESGVTLSDESIMYCHLGIEPSREFILKNQNLLHRKKTAFFSSDLQAIGVINGLNVLGCNIPGDVQVLGMNDISLASAFAPKLSTLQVPAEEMVSKGCKRLVELIDIGIS